MTDPSPDPLLSSARHPDGRMSRVNDILLGPLERPVLDWFCRRMPRWVTPDVLTVVGIAGGIITCLAYWLTGIHDAFRFLACAGLIINWFGDSLDGSVARFRHIQRPRYGFFLDHVTDALVTSLVCIGIGLSPYITMDYALVLLVAYLLMSILTYVTGLASGVFRISYGKFGPTEMRVALIVATIACPHVPNPRILLGSFQVTLFDGLLLGVAIIMMIFFAVAAWMTGRQLASADPAPGPSTPPNRDTPPRGQ